MASEYLGVLTVYLRASRPAFAVIHKNFSEVCMGPSWLGGSRVNGTGRGGGGGTSGMIGNGVYGGGTKELQIPTFS